MKYASILSTERDTSSAVRQLLEGVGDQLGTAQADLAVAFASREHADGLDRLAEECRRGRLARHVLGCTGESIVGVEREIEGSPAFSLWVAQFPEGTSVRPVRLTFESGRFQGWPDDAPAERVADSTLVMLGDPFSFPAEQWLSWQGKGAPGLRVVGGMASAGGRPGVNRLLLDAETFEGGAVGALIDGPLRIRTVVSQGCRPIGRPMIVTRVDGNVVKELGRRPALEVFREVYEALPPADQELVREGLHLGRVMNEYQEGFRRGDFLIRNVIGADDEGGVAITDEIRVGQTVQFHVRDAATADEDLRALIDEAAIGPGRAGGALVFTCNGRGTRLFPTPHHDACAIGERLGPIPLAGFFAMGEIGPVGRHNFLHGFTASIALFES